MPALTAWHKGRSTRHAVVMRSLRWSRKSCGRVNMSELLWFVLSSALGWLAVKIGFALVPAETAPRDASSGWVENRGEESSRRHARAG